MDQVLGSQSEAELRAWAGTGKSAASWPAILAGAFVAVSASLILIVLGSGLGFAAVSPWPGRGASAAGLTVTAAIWLIVTQWISAALGGYVAGRLRTKWTGDPYARGVFSRYRARPHHVVGCDRVHHLGDRGLGFIGDRRWHARGRGSGTPPPRRDRSPRVPPRRR